MRKQVKEKFGFHPFYVCKRRKPRPREAKSSGEGAASWLAVDRLRLGLAGSLLIWSLNQTQIISVTSATGKGIS